MAQIVSNNRSATSWLPMPDKQNESAGTIPVADGTEDGACTTPVPAPVAMPQGIPVSAATLAGMKTTPNGPTSTASGDTSTPDNSVLANTKEKTPMCLVNELARFNQLTHQYTLTDEQGPAHNKQFFVMLTLGSEKYAASGASIKKAQHAAARKALESTVYKHPPAKVPRRNTVPAKSNITPTMQLNALAMKLGQVTQYIPLEAPRRSYYPPPNLNFRGMYNQRYHYPYAQRVFYVVLRVGDREFSGEGGTRQAARHSAATKALHVLNNLPTPQLVTAASTATAGEGVGTGNTASDSDADDNVDNSLKSEISLVHEIALKRQLSVDFQVQHEAGPPHMRHFIMVCICGELKATGDGSSKKMAKRRAAEQMLVKLRALPPLPPQPSSGAGGRPKKPVLKKKKQKNIIKKVEPEYGAGVNPISRLIQIQQAKRAREPVYSLVTENGMAKLKEFVIEVAVDNEKCSGRGRSKKLAKRVAAEAMLQKLGYSQLAPAPAKPAIKTEGNGGGGGSSGGDKKVTFVDQDSNSGRKMLPGGVIVMPEGTLNAAVNSASPGAYPTTSSSSSSGGLNRAPGAPLQAMSPTAADAARFTVQTIAAVAQEILASGFSQTAEAISKSDGKTHPDLTGASPKEQLLYVADVLQIAVQFTDLPKLQSSNKSEFMSLVSLSTNPPQVSHGSGPTSAISHNMAAHTALRALSDLASRAVAKSHALTVAAEAAGVDKGADTLGAGDGPHVQTMVSSDKRASSEVVT